MNGRSSGPNESVVPPWNQQMAPALTPARTMPGCQALRITSSRPCTRQTATMLATLPPPTKITSWDSSRSSGSLTLGIGKSCRWLGRAPCCDSLAYMRT